MKPTLVCVHIFYPELWTEIKQYLENIHSCPWQLYVTLVAENHKLQADILQFCPSAVICMVDNKGFDVGPFFHILNRIDLNKFSYIIKIHTKRNYPQGGKLKRIDVSGAKWRHYALAFLSSKNGFQRCLSAFDRDPSLGMVGQDILIFHEEPAEKEAEEKCRSGLKELGLPDAFGFVAGSIFMVRACLFLPLQRLDWQLDSFGIADRKVVTKAHIAERLLGSVVVAQGYVIKDVFSDSNLLGKEERHGFFYEKELIKERDDKEAFYTERYRVFNRYVFFKKKLRKSTTEYYIFNILFYKKIRNIKDGKKIFLYKLFGLPIFYKKRKLF